MTYRTLAKDDSGKYTLESKDVFSLPLSMVVNPDEDSAKIDNAFITALETVTRWRVEEHIYKLNRKLETMTESPVASVSAMESVKANIKGLKDLAAQLPCESIKPEPWFIALACTIERPNFINFNGADTLIHVIKAAEKTSDYKAVRDSILDFGKGFIPSENSGIKPRKPSFRLNNMHDGRYSIEELVSACTARKSVVTRKGAKYKAPKDSEILYNCLSEIFRECYGIPVTGKKPERPKFSRNAF